MLGEWLVLMVATSVRELCRSYIDDAFASTRRHLMNEAHKILVGVAEAHATTHTALEE